MKRPENPYVSDVAPEHTMGTEAAIFEAGVSAGIKARNKAVINRLKEIQSLCTEMPSDWIYADPTPPGRKFNVTEFASMIESFMDELDDEATDDD